MRFLLVVITVIVIVAAAASAASRYYLYDTIPLYSLAVASGKITRSPGLRFAGDKPRWVYNALRVVAIPFTKCEYALTATELPDADPTAIAESRLIRSKSDLLKYPSAVRIMRMGATLVYYGHGDSCLGIECVDIP